MKTGSLLEYRHKMVNLYEGKIQVIASQIRRLHREQKGMSVPYPERQPHPSPSTMSEAKNHVRRDCLVRVLSQLRTSLPRSLLFPANPTAPSSPNERYYFQKRKTC